MKASPVNFIFIGSNENCTINATVRPASLATIYFKMLFNTFQHGIFIK